MVEELWSTLVIATQQTFSVFMISVLSQEKKETLLDYVEKYVMTCLHRILFCPPSTTDEEKDLSIQKRYDHILHLPWNIHTSVLKLCSIHICRVIFFNYPFIIFLLGFDSWIGWIHSIWIAESMRQNQKSVIWCTQQLQVCSMCFYHKKCVSFSAELWFSKALSFGDLESSNSKLEQLMVRTWLVIFLSTKYRMVWCRYKRRRCITCCLYMFSALWIPVFIFECVLLLLKVILLLENGYM